MIFCKLEEKFWKKQRDRRLILVILDKIELEMHTKHFGKIYYAPIPNYDNFIKHY